MAETGEVLSERADSQDSGTKYGNGGIQPTFKISSKKKRSRKRVDKFTSGIGDGGGSIDSIDRMKVPTPPPFRNGNSRGSMHKMGSIEDGGSFSGQRLNKDYYASGRGLNERASSSNESGPYNDSGSNRMGNQGSLSHMAHNESDFNANTRTVPAKRSNKYHSIDRGAEENEVSPLSMMKKKANVHLMPMQHLKANVMPSGIGQGLVGG